VFLTTKYTLANRNRNNNSNDWLCTYVVVIEPIAAPKIVPIIRMVLKLNVVEISERRNKTQIVIRIHEAFISPRSTAISNPIALMIEKTIENLNGCDLTDKLLNSGVIFSL
jgi:hypothetical protein